MPRDLDIDLLRTFECVARHESFTRAAGDLSRTQSAVSVQIRKLEDIVGARLLDRSNRTVKVTPDGETLLVYANRMLRLNDEALRRVRTADTDAVVRLGAPNDYAACLLPPILSSFAIEHPRITIDLSCDNGTELLSRLAHGKLDVVVATHPVTNVSGEIVRRESLHWVAASGFRCKSADPLPLILFPPGCVCRDVALRALDATERPWRVAVTSRSIAVMLDAVSAGVGVAVMERCTIPQHLEVLDPSPGFPMLRDVAIAVHSRDQTESRAIALAASYLSRSLGDLPGPA